MGTVVAVGNVSIENETGGLVAMITGPAVLFRSGTPGPALGADIAGPDVEKPRGRAVEEFTGKMDMPLPTELVGSNGPPEPNAIGASAVDSGPCVW